jgi:hypothetical protein
MPSRKFSPAGALDESAVTRRLSDVMRRGELERRLYPEATATLRARAHKSAARRLPG